METHNYLGLFFFFQRIIPSSFRCSSFHPFPQTFPNFGPHLLMSGSTASPLTSSCLSPPTHGSLSPFFKALSLTLPLRNNGSFIQTPDILYCLPSSFSALSTYLWLYNERKVTLSSYWPTFWGVLKLSFTFNLKSIWPSRCVSLG